MKITPLEIRQKQFEKKTFGGIDKDEVSAFLNSLSIAWEKMLDENNMLRTKLEQAEKEVQKLREVESSLYKTLKTAEETSNTIVEQANKTAALTIKEAEIKADELLKAARWNAKTMLEEAEEQTKKSYAEIQQEVKNLEREFQAIENMRGTFISEIKNMARDILDKVEKADAKSVRMQAKAPQMPETSPEITKMKRELNDAEKPAAPTLFDLTPTVEAPQIPNPEPTVLEKPVKEAEPTVAAKTPSTSVKEAAPSAAVNEEKSSNVGGSFFDNL
jgi:cell division initiation protein